MAIDAFLLSIGTHRGFKLRFSSEEDSEHCRTSIDLVNGGLLQFKRDNESAIYCSYYVKMRRNQTLSMHVEKYEKYAEYFNTKFCTIVAPLKLQLDQKDLLPELLCKNETQPAVRLPFPVTLKLSGNKRNKLRELNLQYRIYDCGGILPIVSGDNLTITQPKIAQLGGNLECAWAVWPHGSSEADYMEELENLDYWMEDAQFVIELRTDFKGSCEDQYLLLYNGPNQNSPHLGRFCNQASATNLIVERGLFFEYITTSFEALSTFNISIKQGSGCGGKLTYPYRQIVFAEQYKNNVECIWEVVTKPGFHLDVSFVGRFFIESSEDCRKDYLKVEQKNMQGEWVDLQKICGREPPATIRSNSTEIRLIFRSDGETVGDGFTAQFERNCGGILYATNDNQTLASPGYPDSYLNNLVCNYTILPSDPSNSGMLVRFLHFEIEESPSGNCIFDNVTVYVKERRKSVTETVLCGVSKTHEFRAKERISVVLRTDMSFAYKGFLMEYSNNLCGGLITNATIIQTPRRHSDNNFPSNSNCYWNLTAPAGYKILIKFEELDFESQMSCTYDAVEIYKGLLPVLDQRLAKLCGNLTGHLPMLSIPTNTALIHSFTDESDDSRGFRAIINFVPNCDAEIFLGTNNATYEFNRYAGNYANNLDCVFLFSTSPGRQIKIEFSTFHVEDSLNCINDYLELRDGGGPFADSIGVFCGHEIPEALMSTKNAMFLRFVTDAQETSTGFVARVKSIPLACGNPNIEIKGTEKIILKSPDGSNGNYLPNLNCYWKIKSDTNIHLQFEKLDIQEPNSKGICEHDFIKIYNTEDADKIEKGYGSDVVFNSREGSNVSSYFSYAVQHIYCGSGLPDDYFTATKEVFVKFRTDSTVEKSGYKIIASATAGCFRNFTGTQGRILLSETSDHCDIYIKAPKNYSLSLYFSEAIFSEVDCDKEYIEVFETKTNTSLQKDCHYVSAGRSLFTNHTELRMRIKMSGTYTQFDITYLASLNGPGCGGDLYNTAGIITNPFYPNNVRDNADCRWNIRVPSNVHVLLQFDVFDLGAKTTCHSDYLQIIEHNADGTESVVRQFCGEDKPGSYKSNGSFVTVRFHKTVNFDGTGWVLQFSGVYANYRNYAMETHTGLL